MGYYLLNEVPVLLKGEKLILRVGVVPKIHAGQDNVYFTLGKYYIVRHDGSVLDDYGGLIYPLLDPSEKNKSDWKIIDFNHSDDSEEKLHLSCNGKLPTSLLPEGNIKGNIWVTTKPGWNPFMNEETISMKTSNPELVNTRKEITNITYLGDRDVKDYSVDEFLTLIEQATKHIEQLQKFDSNSSVVNKEIDDANSYINELYDLMELVHGVHEDV